MRMKSLPAPIRGLSVLLTATFMYGFFGILSREVGYNIPLFYQNFIRAMIVLVLFSAYAVWKREWQPLSRSDLFWLTLRSVAGTAAFILFFMSVNVLPIGSVYFILYAGSLVGGYLLGMALFKERLTGTKILSFGIGLIGLAIIYQNGLAVTNILWTLVALFSGFMTSVWNVLAKKLPHSLSVAEITIVDNANAALISFALSLVLGEYWTVPDTSTPWLANIALGVLWTITPIFIVRGFRLLDASIASVIMLAEIVFAAIFAFLVYGEAITLATLIGGACIIAAVILPEYRQLVRLMRKR